MVVPGSGLHCSKHTHTQKKKKGGGGRIWLEAFWPTFRVEHTALFFCFYPLLSYPQDPSHIHAICSAHSLKSMRTMQEESTCHRLLLFLFIFCTIRPHRNPNNKYCLEHCVNIDQNDGPVPKRLQTKQRTRDHRWIQRDRGRIKEMNAQWQQYYLTSSLRAVKSFGDLLAKESFKEILESYQNKSERVYVGYPPSMTDTTEKKTRMGLLGDEHRMVTLNKRWQTILRF